jgi:hypothetical protein
MPKTYIVNRHDAKTNLSKSVEQVLASDLLAMRLSWHVTVKPWCALCLSTKTDTTTVK